MKWKIMSSLQDLLVFSLKDPIYLDRILDFFPHKNCHQMSTGKLFPKIVIKCSLYLFLCVPFLSSSLSSYCNLGMMNWAEKASSGAPVGTPGNGPLEPAMSI